MRCSYAAGQCAFSGSYDDDGTAISLSVTVQAGSSTILSANNQVTGGGFTAASPGGGGGPYTISNLTLFSDGTCSADGSTGWSFSVSGAAGGEDVNFGTPQDILGFYLIDGNNQVLETGSLSMTANTADTQSGFVFVSATPADPGAFQIVVFEDDDFVAPLSDGQTYTTNSDELATLSFDASTFDSDCPAASAPAPTVTLSGGGSAAEATATRTILATLSAPASTDTTVNLAYSGTATGSGTDYSAATSITITAGDTTGTTNITVFGEAVVEADETIIVDISSVSGGDGATEDGPQQQTFTIANDDSAAVTIADVTVNENSGTATVTLTLDNAVDGGFDVDVSTSDGTATTADSDYVAVVNATETFAGTAGETQSFDITLGGDAKVEADETITVSMSNLVPTTIASGDLAITDTATVTLNNDDTATITIADESGNEDDGAVTFTVSVDNAVDGGFMVDVSTADGTATTADSDYTAVTNQTLTFAGTSGETETFTVTPTADGTAEANETVSISMSNLVPTTVSSGDLDITDGATLTITNDDSITASIDDPTVAENSGPLTFTVTLSAAAPAGGATIDYATSNGAATAGSDYTATSGTLTFLAGETSKTVDVTLVGDTTVEVDETFSLTLSNPTGTDVTIGDGTGVGTLTNDDSASVTIADVAVNENDGTATVTLTLDNAVDGGFDVNVSTADGTATTADSDYTAVVGATETFAGTAGETETFTITLGGDTKVEADETISVSMSGLVPVSVSSGDLTITDTATVTLTNDDIAVITIADAAGNEDDGAITVTVTVDNAVDGGFDVDVSTTDGTATLADSDYTAVVNQTLTFTGSAGESETFTITPTADVTPEASETVFVSMSNLLAATVASNDLDITDSATLTINNDDSITASVSDPSVAENSGTLTFTVTLSAPAPAGGATVDYATSNGAATAGADYTAASGTVSFAVGETSKTVDIAVTGDGVVERDETLTLTLSNPTGTGLTIGDATGAGTITNDDAATVTIADVTVNENDGTATVTLTLDNAVDGGFEVDVSTSDGTATTADSDYTAVVNAAETFAGTAGETQTFTITLGGDAKVEADETLSVSMSDLVPATVSSGDITITDTATVTIINDDTASITVADISGLESGTFTLTVSVDNAVDGGFSVDLATSDGTAVAPGDYTALSGTTLTFSGTASEQRTQVLTVTNDGLVEVDETLTVALGNVVAATVDAADIASSDTALVLIENDDAPLVTLNAIDPNPVAEANQSATIEVGLTAAALEDTVVTLGFTGTATGGGVDYTVASTGVTILAGQASATTTLTTVQDTLYEPVSETIIVDIIGVTGGNGASESGVQQRTVSILEDDGAPTISIADVTVGEGATGASVMTFTVSLSNASAGTVTVDYATSDGSATAGSDYTAASGTLTFAPGETEQTVDVTVAGDAIVELDEAFTVTLSAPSNATLSDSEATGTITNDDAATLSVADVTQAEGDAGASTFDFTVTLSAESDAAVDFTASTLDGTAEAGSDYVALSAAPFTIAAGDTSATVQVTVSGDAGFEPGETFTVTLAGLTASGRDVSFADDEATGTISNDDAAPLVTLAASPTTVSENAGTSTLTASLSASSTEDVTVELAYADANVTGPASIVVPAGDTSAGVTVTAVDNALDEPDRTVEISIDGVTNGTEDGTQAVTLTLTDDDAAPGLSVADVSLAEGASGTSVMTFTVSLGAASGNTVTVDYATSDDTATAGSDYTAASGTLTFAPGETEQTVDVTVAGDAIVELDEAFTVTLSAPSNATISDSEATGTITNDDAATLSIADVTQAEGDAGASTFDFTVTLSAESDAAVDFTASTLDGTAEAGSDYVALSAAPFTIAAGDTSATVQVTVSGDAGFEPGETFTVTLAGLAASGRDVSLADNEATGTISNDDAAPLVTLAASPTTVSENAGTSTLTASLSASSTEDVTVELAYADANVTGPASIVVPAGDTSAGVTVTAVDNALDEPDRTVEISIDAVTNGTEDGTQAVTLTLTDDDAAPGLSVADVSLAEGASGTSVMTFTVSLGAASGNTVTVDYATSDDTATAGSDYTAATGTLTFTPGDTEETVDVTIAGDAIVELDEAFTVTLSAPSNATLSDSEATGTITNDDAATLSVADVTQNEGDAGASTFDFTVTLSAESDAAVDFTASTLDGTAEAGSDYVALSAAPFTIAAGDTSATVQVTVSGDAGFEPGETFTVTLAGLAASGRDVSLADNEATGTISNDDAAPTLALNRPTVSEAAGTAVVTATLNAPAAIPVTFTWSTQDGSAASPADFTAVTDAAATIAPGETSVDLPVALIDDATEELAETFQITLAGLSNALSADTAATITIEASDIVAPEPTLSVAEGLVAGAFTVSVAFTEPVTGLALSDFEATNAALSDLSGSDEDYTLIVTPSADGPVTLALPAGAAEDGLGTPSTAAEPLNLTADLTAPGVVLSTEANGVISGPFQVTITFTEAVSGFELADLAVENGEASDLATDDDTVFTAAITPVVDGTVTVSLAAGAASDAAGNASTEAEPLSVMTDATPPSLEIALPGEETTGAFTASFTFSEPVEGFELADITIANGAASALTSSDDTIFTAEITPQTPGTVIVSVAAGAATDAGGNASLAASADLQAVSVSEGVVLVLDASVADPASVTATTILTNPGSDPLAFTATADVDWIDVTPGSGVIASLGALDLEITLNDAVNALAAGEYVGAVTVRLGAGAASAGALRPASSPGMILVEIPVSLQLQARFGSLTLVAVTPSGAGGEASFSYTSDIEAFDGLILTTSAGRASMSVSDVLQGAYQITQSLPAGWRVESISCEGDLDGGTRFDVQAGAAAIDLDADESLVCTFENVRDEDAVRLATQRAIRGFMARRADRIVEAAPDLSRRFDERATTQRGSIGAEVDGAGRYQMSLGASLSGMRNAAAQQDGAARFANPERPFLDGWDVWLAAEVSGVSDDRAGEGAESDFGVAQLGVDYQIGADLIVGALAQYDWMSETSNEIFEDAGAIRGARVEGEGWMAGPYAVWRIADSLILDGLALYGRSDNQVDPLGLYEDGFETDRFMLRANLTGQFVSGAWRLRPQAGLTHFEETQAAYTDSLGIAIPEQTVSLGRLRAGPEVAWRHEGARGGWLELTTALNAVWDYQTAELLSEAGLLVGGDDDLRADARFGLSALTRWGAIIRVETGVDGLGVGDFQARTARFEIRIPFGAAGRGGGGFAPIFSGERCSHVDDGFQRAASASGAVCEGAGPGVLW
jgi:hypothetical protein